MKMSVKDKGTIIAAIVIIGFIFISMVVLTAYAAELRCENNELIAGNKTLRGEVDTLSIKIKSSNSVANIEKEAKSKLGMVYPTSKNCIYLKNSDLPKDNFSAVIRKAAYN